jgi:hypothetical protein
MGGVWPIFLSIFRPTQFQAVANIAESLHSRKLSFRHATFSETRTAPVRYPLHGTGR